MKKSDLRSGMRVETAGEGRYIVLENVTTILYGDQRYLFCREGSFMNASDYCENLTFANDHDFDVVRIYASPSSSHILNIEKIGKLLWERQEPKEMTLAEIEKELGYPIKIRRK